MAIIIKLAVSCSLRGRQLLTKPYKLKSPSIKTRSDRGNEEIFYNLCFHFDCFCLCGYCCICSPFTMKNRWE